MEPDEIVREVVRAGASKPPVCPLCDYDLAGTESGTCPECGCDVRCEFSLRGTRKHVAWLFAFLGLSTLLWAVATYVATWNNQYGNGPNAALDPISMLAFLFACGSLLGVVAVGIMHKRLAQARLWVYNGVAAYTAFQCILLVLVWVLILMWPLV